MTPTQFKIGGVKEKRFEAKSGGAWILLLALHSGILLVGWGGGGGALGDSGVPEIKPGSATCKASTLPTVLSL